MIINVSSSGFMNDQLQIDYINRVKEPYSRTIGKKNLLICDQHEGQKLRLLKII